MSKQERLKRIDDGVTEQANRFWIAVIFSFQVGVLIGALLSQ